LGNDYFNFDKARHEMVGERTGVKYRLGDRLRVQVSRVDLETTRIDFVLADSSGVKPINDEDSILPERYRDKARKSGETSVKLDIKKPERATLKASNPWDAPKSSRSKKAGPNKNRGPKAGNASSKPNSGSKARPAKSSSRPKSASKKVK
jgi:ribonuclease R